MMRLASSGVAAIPFWPQYTITKLFFICLLFSPSVGGLKFAAKITIKSLPFAAGYDCLTKCYAV